MGRRINKSILGKRFGRLTVMEPVVIDDKVVGYLCRCDCGGEKVVKSGNLTGGMTKSCGCLQREQRKKWSEAGKKENKNPRTLCVSCIRSAAPPELQCIWDRSHARQLPEGAETVIIEKERENGTKHIYIVKCPEYLSLFDAHNAKLLQEARRRNDAWKKRELEMRCGSGL